MAHGVVCTVVSWWIFTVADQEVEHRVKERRRDAVHACLLTHQLGTASPLSHSLYNQKEFDCVVPSCCPLRLLFLRLPLPPPPHCVGEQSSKSSSSRTSLSPNCARL